MTTRGSWIKWPLKSSHPNQFQSQLRQRKQRSSVTLTDERAFRAVGRGNRWESPWWRCIWSFGIHATPYPVSPDWSKGKGPACLFRGLSRPVWQMQSPGKAAGPGFICAGYLLRRSVCSFTPVFFFFISTGIGEPILSAERRCDDRKTKQQLSFTVTNEWLTKSFIKTGAGHSCRAESLQNSSYWSHFDWHSKPPACSKHDV